MTNIWEILSLIEDADDDGDGIEDEDEDHDGDGVTNERKIIFFKIWLSMK